MNHTHLKACSSTQIFLKENLSELRCKNEHILVSTDSQTSGLGRSNHNWTHFPHALAFSCTFPLNEFHLAPSLSLALALVQYFKKNFDKTLMLKWPNDLYTPTGEKCGGLLCYAQDNLLLAGLGLNWGDVPTNSFNGGGIFPGAILTSKQKKELPEEIYQFLIEEFTSKNYQISDWENACFHLKKTVLIKNGTEEYEGLFKGITKEGAAHIGEKIFYSGSLFLKG